MMNRRKLLAMVFSILIVGLCMGNVNAKDTIETDAVTGNVYICYFYFPRGSFQCASDLWGK